MTNRWKRILHIDIETYSPVDLAKSGVYRYAEDEDFQIILFAYAYDDGPVTVLDLTRQELPEKIVRDLDNPAVLKKAHNAAFERICLSRYMRDNVWWMDDNPPHFLSPEGWYCTMVHSSMCGLPLSLKQAGEALGLSEEKKKLTIGSALIRYFCQPCTPAKANGQRTRNFPNNAPEKWADFCAYNKRDVETEMAIEHRLEAIYSMPETELERYWRDQRIADQGICADVDLANRILSYWQKHKDDLWAKAESICGCSASSNKQLSLWIEERTGSPPDNLQKETIESMLEDPALNQDVKEVLKLRLEANATSIKKYEVFEKAVCKDGRIHGMLQFYGSRTGRWAGRMLQPQNMPKNYDDTFHDDRALIKSGMTDILEDFYLLPDSTGMKNPLKALIRTCLVPAEGKKFVIADYAAIEARVIAWLAGEAWRLRAFHEGKDIYCESASQIFKVPVTKHGENGHLRALGKIAELALGYGGGASAMKNFGADDVMTEAEMEQLKVDWRKASPSIPRLWYKLENMASDALQGKTPKGPHGLKMQYRNGILEIQLPSGRCLIYQNPRYMKRKGDWKESLYFDGQDSTKTNKNNFGPISTWGGKLTENVIQAIARDCLAVTIDRLMERFPRWPIEFHVHDEVILEVPAQEADKALQLVLQTMAEPIPWAPGLELKGAGFIADYYQKD